MGVRKSQCMTVLAALQQGASLTTFTAFAKYGITRLAARIYDLRADGHDIVATAKRDGDKWWAEYRLVRR